MFLGCCSHHGGIKDAGAGKPCGLCGFTTRLSQAPVFTPSPSSPLPLTIIYVCKDLKCFSPLCSVKSGMPCTGRETKVCSEQAEKHCSLVVLCLFAGPRGAGGGGKRRFLCWLSPSSSSSWTHAEAAVKPHFHALC